MGLKGKAPSVDWKQMQAYKDEVISYESALFYSTNPSEFALRASGVSSASDRTFSGAVTGGAKGGDLSNDLTP